jgi:hypothetical protein
VEILDSRSPASVLEDAAIVPIDAGVASVACEHIPFDMTQTPLNRGIGYEEHNLRRGPTPRPHRRHNTSGHLKNYKTG